jgi:hypothetical protein
LVFNGRSLSESEGIVSKSKFEQGLDLLEQAIPLLRAGYVEHEADIRKGIIDAISGPSQQPLAVAPPAKINGKRQKAPRGAADAAALAILRDHGDVGWPDFERRAKTYRVSFSALKKAVRRLKEDGKIEQEGFVFRLP